MGMQACRLPLPYFRVDASLRILDRSDEAELLFPGASELAGITDEGSLEKLRRFVRPGSVTRLELNFLCGTDRRPQLFELHQQWEEESAAAHLLLCPLQDRLQRMQDTMEQLRRDLRRPGGAAPPGLRPLSAAPARTSAPSPAAPGAIREAIHALETIEDLIGIIRPDMTEAGKDAYAVLLLEQAALARGHLERL
ncbi:hypothetical protein ACVNS2_27010 [Paenibacillus caseinilyticus]|uniref:Uncharacterized protein n=1 Tax=Paenibacillus mucilaginosus K02 TaxID=997761 RepID=I0BPP1_9BACL|nr:hypothetical protein [Paenibacillus mucilaginosus]AFH64338.2 hypothetical protein B2K_27210 [Paenibacillus mucilaginosus K02]